MDLLTFIWIALAFALGFFIRYLMASGSRRELKLKDDRLEEEALRLSTLESKLDEKAARESSLNAELATANSQITQLKHEIENEKTLLEERNTQLRKDFELLANKILEEKTERFTEKNNQQISEILKPLGEKIINFQKKVEESNEADIRRSTALQTELKHLKELNQQVTREAHSLSQALRGESKSQGQWGEMQLSRILEIAGLEEGIHFSKEESHTSEDGRRQRLDYLIKLPGNRHLILDAKVSLSAFSRYFDTDDEAEKEAHLAQHLSSINHHIKILGGRNYQSLYQINPPDYVMMFIANEPALTIALQKDPDLYEKALRQNIAIVSSTTLLATLRTVSFIWQQDKRQKNAEEIAYQAGALYDKFVNFTEEVQKMGRLLNQTQESYDKALKRLSTGKGNLISRTEKLKELGASSTKKQDKGLLND